VRIGGKSDMAVGGIDVPVHTAHKRAVLALMNAK